MASEVWALQGLQQVPIRYDTMNSESNRFYLGGSATQGNFNGSIDELRIWSTALEESQVISNFQKAYWADAILSDATIPDLAAYYSFEGGNLMQITDHQGGYNLDFFDVITGATTDCTELDCYMDLECSNGGTVDFASNRPSEAPVTNRTSPICHCTSTFSGRLCEVLAPKVQDGSCVAHETNLLAVTHVPAFTEAPVFINGVATVSFASAFVTNRTTFISFRGQTDEKCQYPGIHFSIMFL